MARNLFRYAERKLSPRVYKRKPLALATQLKQRGTSRLHIKHPFETPFKVFQSIFKKKIGNNLFNWKFDQLHFSAQLFFSIAFRNKVRQSYW